MLPLLKGQAESIRPIALYGIFGGAINATDGRYTYFRYPTEMDHKDLFEYTLMPMHNRSLFEVRELAAAELYRGFSFTKGAPVLQIPAVKDAKRSPRQGGFAQTETCLYDLHTDPEQRRPFRDKKIESILMESMKAEMALHEAPEEVYLRFDLR